MSRHKTTIEIVLVAVMLLLATGTPAAARDTVEGRARTRVTRQEQHDAPSLWRWLKAKLTRYAMAAN